MGPAMRICLALVAAVALGALCGGLAVAFHDERGSAGRPARVGPAAAGRKASPAGSDARQDSPAASGGPAPGYSLSTLDDASDLTFNELLGINNLGHIVGYSGSGAAGQPNHAYLVRRPYSQARYQSFSFPGSAQTQLTGLNDKGVQVGFWSTQNNTSGIDNNFGCYLMNGHFRSVNFPTADNMTPPVNQLLGVNDHDIAVGFYTDAKGFDHAYRYDIATKTFTTVAVTGASSVVAAAINNSGSVAGFFANSAGTTEGFVLRPSGQLSVLDFPRATKTRALGVNNSGEVVGDYQLGSGRRARSHGFTWTQRHGFTTVDGPDGAVDTTINGVNNAGELVGSYVTRAGNTDGLLAQPSGAG
jgi:uncharacterized membrane protein